MDSLVMIFASSKRKDEVVNIGIDYIKLSEYSYGKELIICQNSTEQH